MSLFQTKPPERKERHNLSIIRTGPRGKDGGIILASHMYGAPIHFHGRSIPCTQKADCPVCATGNQARWTGYVPVWLPGWIRPSLLELPTAAAEQVDEWEVRHGPIMRKLITATRPKGRANSRIKIVISEHDTTSLKLPSAPDTRRALCLIWRLDFDDVDASLEKKMQDFNRYAEQQESKNGTVASRDL